MNLTVSNIGWDNNELFFSEIKKQGLNFIETIPNKVDLEYRKLLKKYDLKTLSAQSIFYGVECLSFSDERFLKHFDFLINLSKEMGINTLVLGSPKLRHKDDLRHLNTIFNNLDIKLKETNIKVCIEPNAKIYGGQYFFTIKEIVDFINQNDFKNIKTMIDTHNSELEELDFIEEYKSYKDYIKHIHISKIGLENINNFEYYIDFFKLLKKYEYKDLITLEVLNLNNETIKEFKKLDIYY